MKIAAAPYLKGNVTLFFFLLLENSLLSIDIIDWVPKSDTTLTVHQFKISGFSVML